MENKSDPTRKSGKSAPKDREERLKAALKANLARRKAQSRARRTSEGTDNKDE
ncbi:hypothetical protein [Celeribacter baekdonensis]|uniref:Uncharacterized protein n=1 Tax=Celeribacter baekdonensis B30 TaxID=1208323 RepID=K2JRI7_9RHOB|nr:hypothetical protein [Celeribacter baekdonensis]EKE67785.1 hypothetical protein B30_19422 [Celeribacter baekdonensis B30]